MANLKELKALRAGNSIILHYDGDVLNIQQSSRPAEFKRVEKLLEKGDIDGLVDAFLDIKKSIEKYTKDKMSVEDGVLIDKETKEAIPRAISKKLMQFKNKQEDFLPLWRFWQKLKKNPSKNSVKQLYEFILRHNIPITEQGDILLEKGVKMNKDGTLWDAYSGTFDNSIGMVVRMPRDKVTDDPRQGCASGLHVAAPDYVREHYNQEVVVICRVNPTDVGSVPEEYNFTKMRVCEYEVMGLAKHSSIKELVVKLEDFVMLPKVEDRRENSYEDMPLNTATDLMKLTAKKIISYVRKETGKRITIDPKNKVSIAKRAEEILQAAGKTDLPSSKKKGGKKELVFTDLKCKEIIDLVRPVLGNETDDLAGNDPRRARFIAKVTPKLKEQGYSVVD